MARLPRPLLRAAALSLLAASVAAVFGIVFLFFGRNLVGLYTTQQDIIDAGAKILLMVALLQPFQSSQFILAGSMRGAGDTRAVAYITGFTMLISTGGLANDFVIQRANLESLSPNLLYTHRRQENGER